MPKLVAIAGPSRGRQYPLGKLCVLGRGDSCAVYVSDLTVSREHARVVRTPEGYAVEDLQSGNGTYVNDNRVHRQLLAAGDRLRVGESVFRFAAEELKPPPRAPVLDVATVIGDAAMPLLESVTELHQPALVHPVASEGEPLAARLLRVQRMLETVYAVADATTSAVLDPNQLFGTILDYRFELFPVADRGFVMLLDEEQQLVPGAVKRRGGADKAAALTLAQPVLARVIREQKAVLSGPGALLGGERSPSMAAPMLVRGEPVGALHLEGRPEARPFRQEDLDLLAAVALLAAVGYHNASLHQRLMRQQRLELPGPRAGPQQQRHGQPGAGQHVRHHGLRRAGAGQRPADPLQRRPHPAASAARLGGGGGAERGGEPGRGRAPRPDLRGEATVELRPGDALLLCTDGVVEAKNLRGEEFGFEGLHHAVAAAPWGDLPEAVLTEVRRYTRSTPQYDDITLVGIGREVDGSPP